MVKYEGILFYSDDIWNNNREGDFSNAKVVLQPNIDTGECETYYPCALYYEKEATDSLGYTCLDINSDKYEGMDIFKITLRNKSGAVSTLMLPKSTRKFPVAFGGLQGTAVSFYIDGVETYKKANRDKAVKFIKNRLEKLRECESPFQAESSAMIVEEMASEFSVERINPTVVSGQSDMKAESFAAENLAVADVDIHNGMNIPAGSGSIVGQAIPETDFTPFGASAEENLAVADVDIHNGMNIPAGSGSIVGQAIPETDFTPFGASAESIGRGTDEVNANIIIDKLKIVDDEGLVEVGNYFGISNDDNEELYDEILKAIKNSPSSYLTQLQVILDDEYNAESCACGANETCMCAETDVIPNEPDMSAIIGQTSDGQPYTPFGYAAENLAVADVEVWDGMVLPEGTGAIIGQATPATDYTPFGVSAESYMEETFKPDGMGEVVGAITAETDYTPFGASAESFSGANNERLKDSISIYDEDDDEFYGIKDIRISHADVLGEDAIYLVLNNGSYSDSSITYEDILPFVKGIRREELLDSVTIYDEDDDEFYGIKDIRISHPDGDVDDVIGEDAIYLVLNNGSYSDSSITYKDIFDGAEYKVAEDDVDFDKVKADRNKDGRISDWERAVGNKVAKGKREYGAEMYSGYGGMLGVAAAFVAGVGFRYWSGKKLNGDESPDSSSQNDVKDSSQE